MDLAPLLSVPKKDLLTKKATPGEALKEKCPQVVALHSLLDHFTRAAVAVEHYPIPAMLPMVVIPKYFSEPNFTAPWKNY